jgi:hypothetical protein
VFYINGYFFLSFSSSFYVHATCNLWQGHFKFHGLCKYILRLHGRNNLLMLILLKVMGFQRLLQQYMYFSYIVVLCSIMVSPGYYSPNYLTPGGSISGEQEYVRSPASLFTRNVVSSASHHESESNSQF